MSEAEVKEANRKAKKLRSQICAEKVDVYLSR